MDFLIVLGISFGGAMLILTVLGIALSYGLEDLVLAAKET